MKPKYYYSNWELVLGVTTCIIGLIVFGYKERGFDQAFLCGVGLCLFAIIYLVISKCQSYITINGRHLTVKGQQDFGSDLVDIYSILFIGRIRANILPKWGCQITIFYSDMNNQLQWFSIRELNYSVATIKSLLSDLSEMNHQIELDEQYVSLLKGVYEQDFFRSVPAESSILEIKNNLSRKGDTSNKTQKSIAK